MKLLLALSLLQQGIAPDVSVDVDRNRIQVGEEITYTVKAVSRSAEPLRLRLAPVDGLEIIARSERTEVGVGAGGSRTTVLELRLRALRAGNFRLGPVVAVQGGEESETRVITVEVRDSPGLAAVAVNPRIRSLLERAPPPAAGGQVAVTIVLSNDSARIGEQVDVLTAAWFPRDVRLRLRRPPMLQPPTVDGAWSYPQPSPTGIAASRRVDETWYDLFVVHQVVFPLVPGRLDISPATLKFSLPVTLQFFSQEERYTLTSTAGAIEVLSLPTAGRPAGFNGTVARGLTLERTIDPPSGQVGEPVMMELAVVGEGNVALWPAPDLRWPPSVRAYPDRTNERLTQTGGLVGGKKRFRYLVVPDSAGSVVLPAIAYPYFDLASGRYEIARAPAATLPVGRSGEAATTRVDPPPLLQAGEPGLAWRVMRGVPLPAWLLLLLAPPSLWLARRLVGSRRWRRRAAPVPTSTLASAESALELAVRRLVPEAGQLSAPLLVTALRAAGIEQTSAERVVALRDELRAIRYGPQTAAEPEGLAEEASALAAGLGRPGRPSARRTAVAVGLVLAMSAVPAIAQAPGPERLYASGALRAAAEGFLARADAEPAIAAHWYNAGAALYRLGSDGQAAAAWLHAERIAPRNGAIRRALRLVPPPEEDSARLAWTSPVTVDELLVLAALAWVVGWLGLAIDRSAHTRWPLALGTAVLLGAAALAVHHWYQQPLGLLAHDTPLRLSPHGRAPAVVSLTIGTAVQPRRTHPGWVLVEAPGRRTGWVPLEALAFVVPPRGGA